MKRPHPFTPINAIAFGHELLSWYDQTARDLPWRQTDDPYAVLVSEIMLQQTQVATVIPYYHNFLQRFPSVDELADAPLEAVLEVWKGLGYYRRARMLHRAAKEIVATFDGQIPRHVNELGSLPGIGPYTAAAVASISFGVPIAVVDGNVLRVATRLLWIEDPIDRTRAKRRVQRSMNALIRRDRPGDFNQAVMELGATICSPTNPTCHVCPVELFCRARQIDRVQELPHRNQRVAPTVEHRAVGVVELNGKFLMIRRPEEGLLAGLWEFVNVALPGDKKTHTSQLLKESVHSLTGRTPKECRSVGQIEHRFSHRVWKIDVYHLIVSDEEGAHGTVLEKREQYRVNQDANQKMPQETEENTGTPYVWVPADRLVQMALPKVMEKVWETARS